MDLQTLAPNAPLPQLVDQPCSLTNRSQAKKEQRHSSIRVARVSRGETAERHVRRALPPLPKQTKMIIPRLLTDDSGPTGGVRPIELTPTTAGVESTLASPVREFHLTLKCRRET
jgi:hypothetical protein